MDAAIMEGKNLNCGSIACVENIKNPREVAKLIENLMVKTKDDRFKQ